MVKILTSEDYKKKIFPEQANNNYQGHRVAYVTFIIITILTLGRSCIHVFAQDGGATSIAGVDTSLLDGKNVISMFALWGESQLLMGVIYVIVILYYRNLIPLMYILVIIEYFGRILIGFYKPLTTMHVPPGAIGNFIIIPLALIMMKLSLMQKK